MRKALTFLTAASTLLFFGSAMTPVFTYEAQAADRGGTAESVGTDASGTGRLTSLVDMQGKGKGPGPGHVRGHGEHHEKGKGKCGGHETETFSLPDNAPDWLLKLAK